MPSSNLLLVPHVCTRIRELMPISILDIGIGFGKYGFLAREYMDICKQRYQAETWETKIDGIEIFPDYVGDLQRLIYNDIYIGDAFDCLEKLGDYDLILLIDMIEHLPKERGFELLELIKKKSKTALISTPVRVISLGKPSMKYGNKYESHVSKWKREELERFGCVQQIPTGKKPTYFLDTGK
jgi:hypothetical protein